MGQHHAFAPGLSDTSDLALAVPPPVLLDLQSSQSQLQCKGQLSFIADALVGSTALSPAFEASVIPRYYFTGVGLLSMKPIESSPKDGNYLIFNFV